MSDDETRVPDLLLERYRLGELSPTEAAWLRERLENDAELQSRLQALADSDDEIHRRYPPGWLAAQVRARLAARRPAGARRRSWSRYWPVPALLATAAAFVLVLSPHLLERPPRAPSTSPFPAPAVAASGDERIKGLRPRLVLFRKTPTGSEEIADGAAVRRGDEVRVGYHAAGRPYGVILSIDGRGTVTFHLPAQGSQAVRLRSGGTVLLSHGYELDDAPRFERFYFVTSETPFLLTPVREAARRAAASGAAAALKLPGTFEQSTFSLLKEKKP